MNTMKILKKEETNLPKHDQAKFNNFDLRFQANNNVHVSFCHGNNHKLKIYHSKAGLEKKYKFFDETIQNYIY